MLHQYYFIWNKVGIWFIKYKIQLDSTDLFHCAHRFKQKNHIFYQNHSFAPAAAAVVVVVIGSSFFSSSFSFLIHLFFIQFTLRCQLWEWCGTVLAMKWLPTESQMDSIFFILGLSVYFLICSYNKNVIRHDYMHLWYVSKILINYFIDFKNSIHKNIQTLLKALHLRLRK